LISSNFSLPEACCRLSVIAFPLATQGVKKATAPVTGKATNIGPRAFSIRWVARVTAMYWIYWDTFWSLVFSAVWFMTIVSHPDAEVTDR
jgi:hypothetical protein